MGARRRDFQVGQLMAHADKDKFSVHKQITLFTRDSDKMDTAVRVTKFLHDRVIDENAVIRVPMFLTGQCKAFGQLIDGIN